MIELSYPLHPSYPSILSIHLSLHITLIHQSTNHSISIYPLINIQIAIKYLHHSPIVCKDPGVVEAQLVPRERTRIYGYNDIMAYYDGRSDGETMVCYKDCMNYYYYQHHHHYHHQGLMVRRWYVIKIA